MPIEFHKELKAKLVRDLALILSKTSYYNGNNLDFLSMGSFWEFDGHIKNRKEFDKLTAYLGERPIYTFVTAYLSRVLADHAVYEKGAAGLLSELECFGDATELAHRLVDLLESLPWQFTVSYTLPEAFDQIFDGGATEFVLSEKIRLLKVTEDVREEFPLTSDAPRVKFSEGIAGWYIPETLPLGRVLFQTKVDGYIGVYGQGHAVRTAEHRLKAFIGFLIASRTWSITFQNLIVPPSTRVVTYEKHGERYEITRKEYLDQDFSKLLARARVNDLDGSIALDRLPGWITFGLLQARIGFSEGRGAEKLQLASKWLAEGYSNSHDLLGFVQAMISLEIMLGDQEDSQELSLGAVIRNRCAYLIGRSAEERDEISDRLKAIYRVRSKIVHTGKDQLLSEDYVNLLLLRDYCIRVIGRELDMLDDAKKKGA